MINQMKRKILAVGIVALFAFATTIGATFAWFSIGQATDMQSIELTISSSTSLLIRMDNPAMDYGTPTGELYYKDPTNYVSTLDTGTILASYNYNNINFRPVTSTNGTTITYRDPLATLPSSSVLTPGAGQYIQFKVWILSQSAGAEVALQDYSITATNANTNKNDVINAIRVSMTAGTTTKIYGIDKDYSFAFGVDDAGYDSIVTENNTIGVDPASIAFFHGTFNKTSGGAVAGESVAQSIATATTLLNLLSNVPTQVTIRIWVEGWDADSNNNVINSAFSLSFTFAVKPVII